MCSSERLIPYKRMKRILKKELNGEITEQLVKYLQTVLENQLKEICRDVVILHQEQNRLRKLHGLCEKKRIDATLYMNTLVDGYIPSTAIVSLGEVAKLENTTLSEARIEVQ